MPRPREWLRVRVAFVLRLIARYELQHNKPAADALRALLRQHRIQVDETEVQRLIIELTS